ncbi:MAG: hypothetical protein HUJ61_04040, partial [Bacilli bacterium]|nr:hypothetical protein [Bacilli bacterium]
MKVKTRLYVKKVDDITYQIPITYKNQRGLYLRARKDGSFACSAPIMMSETKVIKFIDGNLKTLINRVNKRKDNEKVNEG